MHVTSTIDYYEQHASQYVKDTLTAELQEIYQPFLEALPSHGRILDAGCGAGRDALAFEKRGYRVTAFDGCSALAAHASKLLGRKVAVQRFDQFDTSGRYNGVWACASLLHVPATDLPEIFQRLWQTLVPEGVFYCSFKWGQGERLEEGRLFTDADAVQIEQWTAGLEGCIRRQSWITDDKRPGRSEQWLNVLLFKAAA